MSRPLVAALLRQSVERTPVWVMRQAGRHLPEYRELRRGATFQESVSDPEIAAEITLQPIRRYGMDGAVIFADIMTPLEAMGVEVEFSPGPVLRPHTLDEVVALPAFDPARGGFVGETIRRVRAAVSDETAVIGFCGSPITLLAYLLEGGGSKDFMAMRSALRSQPEKSRLALSAIATAMHDYLGMQISAGADAVQVFDSWVGVLPRDEVSRFAVPAARDVVAGLNAPTIYFGPHAPHAVDLFGGVGATAYGIDWRTSLTDARALLGDVALQGNLDPAVLFAGREVIAGEVGRIVGEMSGVPGHVFNLGHGIDRNTDPASVSAMVEAVRAASVVN